MTRILFAFCLGAATLAGLTAAGFASPAATLPGLEGSRIPDFAIYQRNPYPSDPCQRVPPPRACG